MTSIQQTDEELLADFIGGNRDALGRLYERYLEMVYGVCLRYLGEDAAASDASMEIFEEVWRKAPEANVKSFRPWLYVVAKNFCLMELRRRKKNLTQEISLEDMHSVGILHPLDENADQNDKQAALLRRCLEGLSAEQKACIEAFYWEKESYKNIARKHQASTGWVRSQLQNGRRNLKICINNG